MGCRHKLLLSFMIWGFVLLYGTAVAAALTPPEIAKIAEDSTVLLDIRDAYGKRWRGSGFFVGPNQIATNYHVIENMSIGYAKLVEKEKWYGIKVLTVDKDHDLAVVKVTGIDVPALPLGDSDAVQKGDKVYVMGNPQGLEGTLTEGLISAIRPEGIPLVRGKTLQMDASISKGSSGGPVLNSSGEVIGIAVAGEGFVKPDGHVPQNLNFAIAVNYLKPLVTMPISSTPVKPKPVKPKVEPPLVEPKPAKPQVDPLPVQPKPVKPQPPAEPKPALTPQEIYKIAKGSTVVLGIVDAQVNPLARGSGFFVGPNQIATNYHVIEAILNEGAVGGAKLVGKEEIYAIEKIVAHSKNHDLAIVKVREVKITGIDVPALPLGDSDAVQIGDKVYVAGNPEGLEGTFSDGIISAIRGNSTDKIFQMTAPISPGSSGGPVLNNSGKVIGISVGGMEHGQNLNFAIPVNYLKVIMPTTPTPAEPEPVNPPPVEPNPQPRLDTLEKGVKLYEQAKYNEAIKVLSSAIRELEDPERQAEAYLYLGCSKRGFGEGNDKVREHFEESIRHNPNQKLPPRVGKDHPIFAELLEEVRKELTGELTVISLLPQTEIWIFGTGTDRKMLGTGIVSSRLLRGNYIVEGIYAGESRRKTVAIEPDRHEVLDLEIPPIVEHDSPSRISVGERIPLTLNLISSKAPQQVKIYYTIYDRDSNELAQQNQEMRLWDKEPTSSTWIYKLDLPAQKYGGSIKYHIEVEYENHLTFKQPETQYSHYQISIVDDKPPTISLLYPPEGAKFGAHQKITIRAEVTDNIAVKDVHIHASSFNSQESRKLSAEGSSDIYTIDITGRNIVVLRYYLTATDDEGNESKSENRWLTITEGPDLPPDETPPTIRLIKPPYDGTTFKVNQRITIEAKVTDDTSVEQVRLFYSFSLSSHLFEPSHYSDRSLIETSLGTYTGHIPPQSKAGYIWYYLTATDGRNESKSEVRRLEIKTIPPLPPPTIYQGIWASVAANDASTSDRDGGNMFRLAYLREGKTHPTLGGQLNFSYPDHTNVSATVQWGPPALGKSNIAFTLLGGIAEYENFLATGTAARSTHMTPILGAGLKFYPRDKIVIDATSSIKFRSDYDTTGLYHYEIGARFYITRELNLRIGYGKLYLGNRNFTTIQVGLGYTF